MGNITKKKTAAHPIEKLLNNSTMLSTDASSIKASMDRLKGLRKLYMQENSQSNQVLSLPARKKKK